MQPAAHFGGAERQAATIVPELRDLGIETTPLIGPGHELGAWMRARGIGDAVHSDRFPGGWPRTGVATTVALPWRYARCLRGLRRQIEDLVRARDIEVIFAAMAFSWIAATPVARRLGIPIVWRAGGTECTGAERRLLGWWARWHRPDHLVCNGDAVQRMYAPLIGAASTVIRNGLDHEQFQPGLGDSTQLRPPGARTVIGFAGRLVPQKRPQDFIAAAARFAHRDDAAFLLAGDGSRRSRYLAHAHALGARTLHVTGYVPDMRDFYAACDVLVLPSRAEGCPNVVLEAMAMGTLVIAADTPAIREIVTHGSDGLLYPVGDVDALAALLAALLACPERRALLVARANRRVSTFTARDCAIRTAALLRDVVATDRPARRSPSVPGTALRA